MARRIFHSFRYSKDYWRVQQIRNMGVVEGQKLLTANEWEAVKQKGASAIEKWIADQLSGKSCVVVLIGSATAGRKWVKYEMKQGWANGKGVVGVYIHGLEDAKGYQTTKGANPLADVRVSTKNGTKDLDAVAKAYDPPYKSSKYVYDHIKSNLEDWVEEAIEIRKKN